VLTQELDYTTGPLDYALLDNSLGPATTADWFPVVAKNTQAPYDPGPYVKAPLTPIARDAASSVPVSSVPAGSAGAAAAPALLAALQVLAGAWAGRAALPRGEARMPLGRAAS
jgi:hypothetical protein